MERVYQNVPNMEPKYNAPVANVSIPNRGVSESYIHSCNAVAASSRSLSELKGPNNVGFEGKKYGLYKDPQSSNSFEDEKLMNEFNDLTPRQIGILQDFNNKAQSESKPMLPSMDYSKQMETFMLKKFAFFFQEFETGTIRYS